MLMKYFLCVSCIIFTQFLFANRISGLVTDNKGKPLPFASITVKGTTRGTTANNEGKYFIDIDPGTYTLVAQYVSYQRLERTVTLTDANATINFELQLQQLSLAEVVVKAGAEDPAYEIIRNAIKKRSYYLNQLKEFRFNVYTKGQMRMRDFPKKFMGQKVDFGDGDTSKKKIIYLSETISTVSVQKPDKVKIVVASSKVSGRSDGFGLSAPQVFSFYENNIKIGTNLNPRGFISPISNNALNYYKYKYEGSFFEEGVEINRIKVTPKRKFEPLFSGYINITENDWRIHSVQLQLTKESQMELVDTLRIEQLYIPFNKEIWLIKSQVIYPAIKMFGFDAYGSFVNVYSEFDIEPKFGKKYFDNVIMTYTDSANKKPLSFWDKARPVQLQPDEVRDYEKKDSIELQQKDPRYLDSVDRKNNKVSFTGLVLTGENFSHRKKRENYSINPLADIINFNTVEGLVANFTPTYFKRLDSGNISRRSIFIRPTLRYGFNNKHFNASLSAGYNFGKKYFNSINISAGKRVQQINNANPVPDRNNTFASLLWENNFSKLYENWFGRIAFNKGLGEGITAGISIQYQDRLPLENTTNYKWRELSKRDYTPNYPIELVNENFKRHQAFITSVGVNWQPGSQYIQIPGRKINTGSKYPTLGLNYTMAFNKILGSDVNYAKWRFTISDNLNLRLGGRFSYRFAMGGFTNTDSVQLQDYTHFNGNGLIMAAPYLNSFQVAPYYKYSNTQKFYTTLHVEHHFNGLLTNKIPGFRALNWHLVAGANSFYVNKNNTYFEAFAGFENIFKILRVDFIQAWQSGRRGTTGIRVGFKGVLTGGNDD
jgi:Family of unknown function (DUF5686)/CarboxypepD_reg-like domain